MKLNRFETHDRLLQFTKQKDHISQGCQDCIKNRPEEFGDHPFYIFAHVRTHDNGHTKRLIWEPRLTKPKAQTNSMLFKAFPPSDKINIIWMIPDRSLWNAYGRDLMFEDDITAKSIKAFQFDRASLEFKEEDDLSEEKIEHIYREMSINANNRKRMEKLYVSCEDIS
jgi:hypothetical protein